MRYYLVIMACVVLGHPTFAAKQQTLMGAPATLAVYNYGINLTFPSVECGSTYRIESSFDKHHWTVIREGEFATMGEGFEARCMRDAVDTTTPVTQKTQAIYYRYSEVKDGKVIRRSEIGTVTAEDLQSYWDKN